VNARPTVSIAPLTLNLGTIPWNVTFLATVVGGTPPFVYVWDWADGTNNSSGNPATHEYTTVGNFTVKAWVDDSQGESALSGGLRVKSAPPLANQLVVNPSTTGVGSPISFEAIASGGIPPYSYLWSGLPSSCAALNVATINCSATAYGTYVVSVRVNDSIGDRVTSSAILLIQSQFPFVLVGVGIIVAAGVLVLVAVWAVRRSRRRQSSPGPPVPVRPSGPPPRG
jgi:PKD repeat protein